MAPRRTVARAALTSATLLVAGSTFGCTSVPRRPAPSTADLGAWIDETGAANGRASVTMAAPTPRGPITLPTTIAAPAERPQRPPRRKRIDVDLHDAEITQALQLLADAGRYNLVVQDGVTGKVSAAMHGVDPFDALLAIAEAHGVTVRWDGDVAIVTKR